MIEWNLPAPVTNALNRLWSSGFPAYLVGGCVRDRLLGRQPDDWDITTTARPEETLSVFAGQTVIPTGLKHGTVTVLLEGMSLEITTYRVDGVYLDGRHPEEVTFTTQLREDLARRDFTINAFAYAPQTGLVDCFGSTDDLRERLLRAVGDPDQRFAEDALRILRAVRFSAQLDFTVEPRTADSILHNRERLHQVSAERLLVEWRKLLTGPNAVGALRAFRPVAEVLFPPLTALPAADWSSLLDVLDRLPTEAFSLRQTGFLHGIGCTTPQADHLLRSLRMETVTRQTVLLLLEELNRPLPTDQSGCLRLVQRLGGWSLSRDLFTLRMALDPTDPAISLLQSMTETLEREGTCTAITDLAVNGRDLQALGIPIGPQIGALLHQLLNAVMEERCPNQRENLLTWATHWLQEKEEGK